MSRGQLVLIWIVALVTVAALAAFIVVQWRSGRDAKQVAVSVSLAHAPKSLPEYRRAVKPPTQ